MKAMEILDLLLQKVFLIDRWRARPNSPGKPGEMIERLSDEEREVLKELKSDDIDPTKIPGPAYYCGDYYTDYAADQKFRADKLLFDNRLKIKK
jgi:hypothetical protein